MYGVVLVAGALAAEAFFIHFLVALCNECSPVGLFRRSQYSRLPQVPRKNVIAFPYRAATENAKRRAR